MIKEYEINDNTQLTEHFNIQEFACGCGNCKILHNPELSRKLEQLREKLNCSKIVVTSGHRCKDYDLSVGGFGGGYHVSGEAADICCYDMDGNKISSKVVSCVAQDLGFGGIANITEDYFYTHVDVRTSNKWYGDEQVTTSYSVTDDFYKYYGIKKEVQNGVLKGIDVSYSQKGMDWKKVKTDFCLIRAGYGRETSQKDSQFETHYKGCRDNGIKCGAYWYSYAESEADAVKEANACIEILKGKQFEYPVYYDVEEASQFSRGKAFISSIIRAFCSTLEKAGYFTGLYMSASYLNNYVDDDIKRNYAVWVAHYGVSEPSYSGQYGVWQYSGTGSINGFDGDIDLDYCYTDYPTIIKNAGLNGFGSEVKQPKKTVNVKIEIDDHEYTGLLEEV